ncbi:MAG: Cof-type HAD-IIB family hydrolase [Erysipelotrichaceae bacterium]|nr:Cof-type HAD-IIB family hydrolase [Erysipelotrichaceae bacterium]
MAIKMIITDLDGTFYHRDLSFDKEKFNYLFKQMQANDIKFVVASGNQYYQLCSFFEDRDLMTFVSENGGLIISENKEIFSLTIEKELYLKTLKLLNDLKHLEMIVICGKNYAYMPTNTKPEDFAMIKNYFPRLKYCDDLSLIDDQIIKFAFITKEDKADETAQILNAKLDSSLTAITSGNVCVDIIVKGMHKGRAITQLMEQWNINYDEIMAFGDAFNDLEMLKLAKYGFVMKNGHEKLKEEIGLVCPYTNEEDGVLMMIEEYFKDPNKFLIKYQHDRN